MSFGVYVTLVSDEEFFSSAPEDVNSSESDRWQEEASQRFLFDEPLAGDGEFFNLWHVPAHELGLELLGRVYQHGLSVEGEDLDILNDELDALVAHWSTLDVIDAQAPVITHHWTGETETQSYREHLAERAGNLRTAIEIAKREIGKLGIS